MSRIASGFGRLRVLDWSVHGSPRPNWKQLGMLALIGATGFYVVYPLLLILLNSFNVAPLGQAALYSPQAWVTAWNTAGLWSALWNTLGLAFWYQAISFPISIVLAWLIARTNLPWANRLEFLFWLSFFVPPLSTTLGWILLLDPRVGLLNQVAAGLLSQQVGPFNVFSFNGIVWVHLMSHAISSKVMLLTPSFRRMDSSFEEAGQMSGASALAVRLRITLPLLTPALVIVFMLGLVRLFESFEIELLLGVPIGFYVYSTKIVDLIHSTPPQIAQASALGSITLVLLVVAAPVQQWLTSGRDFTTVTGRMRPKVSDLGAWKWPTFAVVLLLALLLVVVPVAAVVSASLMTRFGFFALRQTWTLANWQSTFADSAFLVSLRNTLLVAASAAIIGTSVFSLLAYVVVKGRGVWGRNLLDFLLWVPSVVPGAIAGLGLLWMFVSVPIFQPLYGSFFIVALAVTAGGITLSTQILKVALLQISRELEEGARMSGASWRTTYIRIVLPLLAPTLVVVATLKFLFAVQATSNIILLANSNTQTLSLLTLSYVTQGQRETAAVVTVLVTLLTVSVAILARRLGLNLGMRT
jgi:iron(III) transport system permease protein